MNKSYVYTGNPIVPHLALNIGDKVLEENKDYELEITDNINVGTAHIQITGKGDYNGVTEYTFEIEPVQARTLSFLADSTLFDYDGKPKTMQIAVKFGEMTLVEGKDYTVNYSDNVLPGKASAMLTFFGNFTGIMNIPFTITDTSSKLVNTSSVSAETIYHGDTVVISLSAEGGIGNYTYSVFYKKDTDKKWTRVHNFPTEQTAEITPVRTDKYKVCVKVKDETETEAKSYFDIDVIDTEEKSVYESN